MEAFLEKELTALGVRGFGFIVLENQLQSLDQNRLHVGLGCILRVSGGRVPKAEVNGARGRLAGLGVGPIGPTWCPLGCVTLWCLLVSSRMS